MPENGYGYLSMEWRVICFFIHLQEGYETFRRPTERLQGRFQTSKQNVMSLEDYVAIT